MSEHFCNCHMNSCPWHPSNHNHGRDLCIQDNLLKKKIPSCFFRAIHENIHAVNDYSIASFIEFYHQHTRCDATQPVLSINENKLTHHK